MGTPVTSPSLGASLEAAGVKTGRLEVVRDLLSETPTCGTRSRRPRAAGGSLGALADGSFVAKPFYRPPGRELGLALITAARDEPRDT